MSDSPIKNGVDSKKIDEDYQLCSEAGEKFRMNNQTESFESRVLVIYTGGTIGMIINKEGVLAPKANEFENKIRQNPLMHDPEYLQTRADKIDYLALPAMKNNKRVLYKVLEHKSLLDSSNMTVSDWINIATDVFDCYAYFDGFVILHGTDTLCYSAAALSFMFENLGKTVIITGSQISIFQPRSDGVDNFITSLILAGNYVIPEVSVYFHNKLMRGNRTIKTSTHEFDAFISPNCLPLVQVGIEIDVDHSAIFRPYTIDSFKIAKDLDKNVGILRIFPDITYATVKSFLDPPMNGVILQTYGSGNFPSNRTDLLELLKSANERGVIIVNCSQCSRGTTSNIYETGMILTNCGVLTGFDMTPEAALTKLSYVLSKSDWSLEKKKQVMLTNIRGELTSEKSSDKGYDLVGAVARLLNLTSDKDKDDLSHLLFPAMLQAAVMKGDLKRVEEIKGYGADLSMKDADNRSAIHIACCEGHFDIVKYLLLNGASVHEKDRHGVTPLDEAITADDHDIIKLLISTGAHLTKDSTLLGDLLTSAAGRGLIKRLESFTLAGADLNLPNSIGMTALHAALLNSQNEVVQYLISNKNVNVNVKDRLGRTAMDLAVQMLNKGAIAVLKNR
uniref:asparaginase n=1 Tax=Cacopsylla melanoneura TaxID=428564 RepID=A0A8D8SFW5_9HEMI